MFVCVLEHTYPCAHVGKENLISVSIANKTQFNFLSTVIKKPSTSQTAIPTLMFTSVVQVLYSSFWEVFR